jgi:hypothetical protein
MQDQQVRPPTRRDRVGTALVVAELHEENLVINVFDDRAESPYRLRRAHRHRGSFDFTPDRSSAF